MDGSRPPHPNPLPRSWGRGQGEGVYVRQDKYGKVDALVNVGQPLVGLTQQNNRCMLTSSFSLI